MGKTQKHQKGAAEYGILRGAFTDCLTSFLWVFLCAALSSLPSLLLPPSSPSLLLEIPINALLPSAFELLSFLLGGGIYNPSCAAAFHLAGISPLPPLRHFALRLPLQAAASASALLSLLRLAPPRFRPFFSPPAPSASALDEAAPTFLMTLALLLAFARWPHRVLFRNSLLALLDALLPLPAAFANPLTAFAWALAGSRLPGRDHFYVYWAGPFAGALAAGFTYRLLAASPPKRPPSAATARVRSRSRHLRRPTGEVVSAARAAFRGLRRSAVVLPRGGKPLPREASPVAAAAAAAAGPRGEARTSGRVLVPFVDGNGKYRRRFDRLRVMNGPNS